MWLSAPIFFSYVSPASLQLVFIQHIEMMRVEHLFIFYKLFTVSGFQSSEIVRELMFYEIQLGLLDVLALDHLNKEVDDVVAEEDGTY